MPDKLLWETILFWPSFLWILVLVAHVDYVEQFRKHIFPFAFHHIFCEVL